MMMMTMMNCFCGMVDRRKAFSLISSRDHCQRSSPSRISDTPSRVWTCAEPEFRLSWMKFCSSDNHYTMPAKVTCFSDLPPTGLQNPIHLLHQYLGSAVNLPLKPIHFLCIQDWHPSEKIEILPTPLQHTPQECFPESVSECRFLPQIIILVFPMFTLRPLASMLWLRCFFFP